MHIARNTKTGAAGQNISPIWKRIAKNNAVIANITFRKTRDFVLTLKNLLVILPFSVEQCVGVTHPRKAACYNKPCLKLTACRSILLSSISYYIYVTVFLPSYGCIHSIISDVTSSNWFQPVKSHSNGKLGGNGDN